MPDPHSILFARPADKILYEKMMLDRGFEREFQECICNVAAARAGKEFESEIAAAGARKFTVVFEGKRVKGNFTLHVSRLEERS